MAAGAEMLGLNSSLVVVVVVFGAKVADVAK